MEASTTREDLVFRSWENFVVLAITTALYCGFVRTHTNSSSYNKWLVETLARDLPTWKELWGRGVSSARRFSLEGSGPSFIPS